MASTKASVVSEAPKPAEDASPIPIKDRIRNLAYLKWLSATGGNTIPDDPEGIKFWVEAEKELGAEGSAS